MSERSRTVRSRGHIHLRRHGGLRFWRRECPTCEREFKWLHAQDETQATPPPESGYFCPYCGIQAQPDAWHTKAQIAAMEALAHREVIGPLLKGFARDLRQIERRSG